MPKIREITTLLATLKLSCGGANIYHLWGETMTEKYRVTQTRYLGDQMLASAGEVVYLYGGNDCGEARKESDRTGFLHVSVTKDQAGNSGSFTMQVGHLLKLTSPQ